ncbi:MAG: hypothetical protein AVDCRST_MAG74-1664 [uncultured Pyrinomonadaceae bacterium]|uniref:Uncharacterized protein n=1 Tax=uncultured Pyrinomonadaceae bacterium TaxID=2283094 RepID=A0A6J4P3A5_9BACT|nr:MAG: hypothetical protein AVDCRST_MAG74-1664 [uncultured Pyrinomonadaceae bacterium]
MENKFVDLETRKIENKAIDTAQVKGWGVDADPENDPTYPMRLRGSEDEHAGYSWERPAQQPIDVEVLHSNERPNVSSTFGTSTPPAGLSGMIRRRAFNFSENSYAHWVPLMLADRIGMVEGVVSDLARGHVPNIFEEMGLKAEWKHNRTGLLLKIAAGAVVTATVISVVRRRRQDSDE